MEQHVKIVAILNIINGILSIGGGLIIFFLLAGIGILTQEEIAMFILNAVGIFFGIIFIAIGIPGLIGGFQLLNHKNSGRILTLIASFINLINFPFGTALGVYSIWVLFHENINDVIPQAKGAPIK